MDLQDVLKMMNQSIKERVENNQEFAAEDMAVFFPVLDDRLREFFEKHPEKQFPAIDIGSGHAGHVVKMALHYREPLFQKELAWYPTDWIPPEGARENAPLERGTRAALKYYLEDSKEKVDNVLFTDKNGEPIFKGDAVTLSGLKAAKFNGRNGRARGLDPNSSEGRIAIQISMDPNDQKSFKQENITYLEETSIEDSILRHLRQEGSYKEFFQGLLDRSAEIDILKHETWSNVQETEGKCALITCSSLLTCLGYRDPTAYRDTMEFASRFLCQDGFLLQYDTTNFGGFGEDLKAFPSTLGLKLEDTFDGPGRGDGKVMKGYLWKKL